MATKVTVEIKNVISYNVVVTVEEESNNSAGVEQEVVCSSARIESAVAIATGFYNTAVKQYPDGEVVMIPNNATPTKGS